MRRRGHGHLAHGLRDRVIGCPDEDIDAHRGVAVVVAHRGGKDLRRPGQQAQEEARCPRERAAAFRLLFYERKGRLGLVGGITG